MTSTVYVRYEVLRNFRNWRFLESATIRAPFAAISRR